MDVKKGDILFVVLAALTILIFLWYLFGNSPTLEQGLLLALLTLAVKNSNDVAMLKERMCNHVDGHAK